MRDLDTILLLYSLRMALVSLEQNPDLDRDYPGMRDLTLLLKRQIGKIESRARLVDDGWLRPDKAAPRKAMGHRKLKSTPTATVPVKTLAPIPKSKGS